MSEFNNVDCRVLSFSPELSSKRLSKAQLIFGKKVIKRIICFCLYILGVQRIEISKALKLPENTVRIMLKTILRDGFEAFFDRRKKGGLISKNDLLCLIDKRKGQQQDYVFTPEKKSELILQFVSNAVLGKSTSGSALANDLKDRTQIDLSDRSIRMYISKFGLKGMDEKLRQMTKKKPLENS